MKTGKTAFLSLMLGATLLFTGGSCAATEVYASPDAAAQEARDGIFKKKKKKKDCDCPGNKKNRRKVARERRKNRTAAILPMQAVFHPAQVLLG